MEPQYHLGKNLYIIEKSQYFGSKLVLKGIIHIVHTQMGWYNMDIKKGKVIVFKKGGETMSAVRVNATPEIKGKFAEEIMAEVRKKPSPQAIERNKKAHGLLLKLRKN
ncbi:hypothetical protein A7D23_14080 [Dehalobacter sp. TeCB1]|uniref:Uncharacterized protein n=2 Tax=Dehalobacter restrictus TaxID=55583 RepID=A0ABN4C024_DEHRP|nr:hypothetical protein DEHRE_03430 [Dehalobacter restrictus DSM 9455]OCZ50888.1 hypothetical protein A7D23_14080 [Dehalobacter sp. TeCB1]